MLCYIQPGEALLVRGYNFRKDQGLRLKSGHEVIVITAISERYLNRFHLDPVTLRLRYDPISISIM